MKSYVQILLLGIFFLLDGCVSLYKPNTINSPLLKKSGDFNASASIGMCGSGLYDLQTAYAVSNHIGIMINGMYHQRKVKSADSLNDNLKISFGETGVGYFKTFGNNEKTLFQCYSGAGYGVSSNKICNSTQPPPEVSAKYFNVFIQPGLAFTNKYFQLSFDIRTNYVHLYNIHSYLSEKFEWWNTNLHSYSDTTLSFVNLEPTVNNESRGREIKRYISVWNNYSCD